MSKFCRLDFTFNGSHKGFVSVKENNVEVANFSFEKDENTFIFRHVSGDISFFSICKKKVSEYFDILEMGCYWVEVEKEFPSSFYKELNKDLEL